MNKTEILAIVVLSLGLLGWFYYASNQVEQGPSERPVDRNRPMAPETGEAVEHEPEPVPGIRETESDSADAKDTEQGEPVAEEPETVKTGPLLDEKTVTLKTSSANIIFSSWGGGVTGVELSRYRQSPDDDSRLLEFDLSRLPALSLSGIEGLGTNSDFKVTLDQASQSVLISRETDYGLAFTRTVKSLDGYNVEITDEFRNTNSAPVELPSYELTTGFMEPVETKATTRMTYLGIDSLAAVGGEGVVHWAKKGPQDNRNSLSDRFSAAVPGGGGCAPFSGRPEKMFPEKIEVRVQRPADWVAAKNKFFVQILDPEAETGGGYAVKAERYMSPAEDPGKPGTWMSNVQLEKVYASIVTPEQLLDGGESVSRSYSYYVGPKKFEILKASGAQKKEIMEFGIFKPICEILLVVMTWINSFIHNYGIAIILLTVIVRVIFWPITHKSTESMKKMQKIQPLVSEIREKYKDKPQKMNQEVMALYKEHKVNPAAGCLPILVQIPVFIALFTVLRSAVELRFAEFLWISDLSEPERLLDFGFTIPVIGWDSLNILPLIMTGVTFVQQKLTPTAGQSQQQKMMALMPVILLVFFYNMPSGLILYWTTSQLIAVAQMGLQRRKAKEEAVSG
jgi:YidC/Oxa1 family membrane protein insertase